jgi:hypothetical protein
MYNRLLLVFPSSGGVVRHDEVEVWLKSYYTISYPM